ncbi:hypothetical protein GALMADRAFT_148536 [Galerina marginata CBS 339.88]|uniref:Uncharacterized protein n=1 Tax=Galerina marginata (strain CBS 339.88) TaxID=685588 RepID=A0A067SD05_GALM3|nr:hypothetical protein GALMADRAFT_148536 [Galerina marginata CBS 339.88]
MTSLDGFPGPFEAANHIGHRKRRTADQPPSTLVDLAFYHHYRLPFAPSLPSPSLKASRTHLVFYYTNHAQTTPCRPSCAPPPHEGCYFQTPLLPTRIPTTPALPPLHAASAFSPTNHLRSAGGAAARPLLLGDTDGVARRQRILLPLHSHLSNILAPLPSSASWPRHSPVTPPPFLVPQALPPSIPPAPPWPSHQPAIRPTYEGQK